MPHRRSVKIALLLAVGPLVSCSGGDDAADEPDVATADAPAQPAGDVGEPDAEPEAESDPDAATAGSGVVCDALTADDVATHALNVQLLAAVRDAGGLEALDALGYDAAEYGETLDTMLDLGGEAADEVAYYAGANERVAALVDAGDSATDEQFAEYQEYVESIDAFIVRQLPVNEALRVQCPELML